MDCNFGHILLVKRAANRLAFLLERVLTGTTDCESPSGEGRPIFNISGRLGGFLLSAHCTARCVGGSRGRW